MYFCIKQVKQASCQQQPDQRYAQYSEIHDMESLLSESRQHPFRQFTLQRYPHAVPAARRNLKRLTFEAAHFIQFDDAVAGGVDDLQSVAYLKFILYVDLGDAVGAADDVADVLLARIFGVAAQVVLMFVSVVAFEEAVGVAAACQRIQRTQQRVIERSARDRIVDGLAVYLRGARDIVDGLGAAFDLQRIHADLHQPLDMLHR